MKGKDFRCLLVSCGIWLTFMFIFSGFTPFQAVAAAKDPIKIGVVHSLSGTAGVFGRYYQGGANMTAVEINNAGGVLGRPIQYIFRDDRSNPEVALREARSLLLQEKVDFLIGGVVSSCTLAMMPLSLEQKRFS